MTRQFFELLGKPEVFRGRGHSPFRTVPKLAGYLCRGVLGHRIQMPYPTFCSFLYETNPQNHKFCPALREQLMCEPRKIYCVSPPE